MLSGVSIELLMKLFPISKTKKSKVPPRPPDIMKKGAVHKDKTKYNRKEKHIEK